MNLFLIGMFKGFDNLKFKRDFREKFYGIEASMFPDKKAVEVLVKKSKEYGFAFGIHYPLIEKDTVYRDPFIFSPDVEERKQAFKYLEGEAAYGQEIGAEYILTHFPKPILVDKSLDFSFWKVDGEKEWIFSELYSVEKLEENLEDMFRKLEEISIKHQIQVVLEFDAVASVFSDTNILIEKLKKYDKIKVCIDTGMLHLQEITDPSFNVLEFIKKMAPFTYIVHLHNLNAIETIPIRHFPVLPEQKTSDGWADIELFIKTIKKYNKDFKVLYEHRSDQISDEDLNRCYRWVEEMLK